MLSKFSLYETRTRFYIVASTQHCEQNGFKILKIDRTCPSDELSITSDQALYTKEQIKDLLATIEDGNKSSGGLQKVVTFFGIVGFVRFLEGYYLIVVTKRSAVALIGGKYIYHIDDTTMIHIPYALSKNEKSSLESRYLSIFNQLDLHKNFYFSYSYDISNSLQTNLQNASNAPVYNDRFIWNFFLIEPALKLIASEWVNPIIHGFVDQSKINVFGHSIFITLIGRRSRFFAGARFLKRGINDQGHVANEVETEQIVCDASTTSFYNPSGLNRGFTSFVQHRGSIPLFWSQENLGMAPKPPIELSIVDPYFSSAALHFDNLFYRYGSPTIVLNLIKSKEKTKRESKLLDEFQQCIAYLNQFLHTDNQIRYIAWDMARASKSHEQDVIEILEMLGKDVIGTTGFYHSGVERRQKGIVRTNCIDCLDRTNAAQFVIGKTALSYQLHALGILSTPQVPFDTDATNLLNAMYHDHGDTLALQYGGSHLVNTMETYRKISAWTSHSRDMIESIKRYYSNSFTDSEKQDAINLFLGNYRPGGGGNDGKLTQIWDMGNDFYLHNEHPRNKRPKRSYVNWYTPSNLLDKPISTTLVPSNAKDYYQEYYRPSLYSSFKRMFSFNMIGTSSELEQDQSPFAIRVNQQQPNRFMIYTLNIGGVKKWLTLSNTPTTPNVTPSKPSRVKNILLIKDKNKDYDTDSSGSESDSSIPSSIPQDAKEKQERPEEDGQKKRATRKKRLMNLNEQIGGNLKSHSTSLLSTRLLTPTVEMTELKDYVRYVSQFNPTDTNVSEHFKNMIKPALGNEKMYLDYIHHMVDEGKDWGLFEDYVGDVKGRDNGAGYQSWLEYGVL